MMLAVGVAVDYSRAVTARAKLQSATDAAVLAGAQATPATQENVTRVATKVFESHAVPLMPTINVAMPSPGEVRVSASAPVPTTFMRFAMFEDVVVHALSVSGTMSAGPIEVALALDNTGSMANDMPALKAAATNLADRLFNQAASNPAFRMSIVPFVAVVNPGKAALEANGGEALDLAAENRLHGDELESQSIAYKAGCSPNADVSVTPPGRGGSGASLPAELSRAARYAFGILGPSAAFAAVPYVSITPNTTFPLTGSRSGPSGEFVPTGFRSMAADASQNVTGCNMLLNPRRISVFDLFDRVPTTTASGAAWNGWKGCVMARPNRTDRAAADYDVTDDAPSASDPDSKFVPYFAYDEQDPDTSSGTYNNNWLADGALTDGSVDRDPTKSGSWNMRTQASMRYANLLKYNSVNRADIAEAGPDTRGPNRACPDEVLPLTNNRGSVMNKIASLRYWNGGGTVVSEGLMWAWRTLSPNKPYATALNYSQNTQKILILMSDGVNELAENGFNSAGRYSGSPIFSDYTAYGFLRNGRFPRETFADGVAYLNSRFEAACTNAKAKGIAVYTVLFREASPAAVDLMRRCATEPSYAYTAANGADLGAAFSSIGGQISKLRLVR